jgi:hypothetical protein
MLIAESAGERKFAPYSPKGLDYTCPECKEAVVLKKGKVVTHHFSHKSGSDCSNGKGESKEHLRAKFLLYTWAVNAGLKCELEYPMETPKGKRRADIYVINDGIQYALEIQKSPIDFDMIEARTESYRSIGVHALWIPVLSKKKNLSSWHLWPILAHNNACWFWEPDEEGLWMGNFTFTTRKGAPMIDWQFHKGSKTFKFGDNLWLKPGYSSPISVKMNTPHKPSKKKIQVDLIEGVMGSFYMRKTDDLSWEPDQKNLFVKSKPVSIGDTQFLINWYSETLSYLVFEWDTPAIEIVRMYVAASEHCEVVKLVMFGEPIRTTRFILSKKVGDQNIILI